MCGLMDPCLEKTSWFFFFCISWLGNVGRADRARLAACLLWGGPAPHSREIREMMRSAALEETRGESAFFPPCWWCHILSFVSSQSWAVICGRISQIHRSPHTLFPSDQTTAESWTQPPVIPNNISLDTKLLPGIRKARVFYNQSPIIVT